MCAVSGKNQFMLLLFSKIFPSHAIEKVACVDLQQMAGYVSFSGLQLRSKHMLFSVMIQLVMCLKLLNVYFMNMKHSVSRALKKADRTNAFS